MEVSLYGGTGFVGRKFQSITPDKVHCIERYSRRPQPNSDILYLISTTHNYNVFDAPTLDVKTNLVVLTETLESWRNHDPNGVFNFVSSWFVYGNEYSLERENSTIQAWDELVGKGYVSRSVGAHENDECHPRGFYSITKRCAEQLVVSYAETFGLKYRILRLGNVLGNDEKASAKKNALQYLINRMKKNEPIDIYEYGDFYRNYMHVFDTVNAIDHIMRVGNTNTIYNVGNKDNYKFMDMINYVKNRVDYKGDITYISQKDFHKTVQAKSFLMNCDKLYSTGFVPYYKTMESILDTLL